MRIGIRNNRNYRPRCESGHDRKESAYHTDDDCNAAPEVRCEIHLLHVLPHFGAEPVAVEEHVHLGAQQQRHEHHVGPKLAHEELSQFLPIGLGPAQMPSPYRRVVHGKKVLAWFEQRQERNPGVC